MKLHIFDNRGELSFFVLFIVLVFGILLTSASGFVWFYLLLLYKKKIEKKHKNEECVHISLCLFIEIYPCV